MPAARTAISPLVIFLGVLAQTQGGQEASHPEQQTPEFRVRIDLVFFDVEVIDRSGAQVLGLKREDFYVREAGKPKEISNFAWLSDRPVSLAAVLDVEGLPREQLVIARRFVSRFAHLLGHDDEIALFTYDRRDAYLETDFTCDRRVLQEALDNIDTAAGGGRSLLRALFGPAPRTALALDVALRKLHEARREKRAVLLVSNGFKGLGPATVEHVQAAGYTVLTLSFSSKSSFLVTLGGDAISKKQILRQSGGRDFAGSAEDLGTPARTMALSLKSHYSIGYLATVDGVEGKPRKVEITLPGKDHNVYYRRSFTPTN